MGLFAISLVVILFHFLEEMNDAPVSNFDRISIFLLPPHFLFNQF